ncbi:unnamed protein product [Adineta steineri]|uniref:Uncharacterized protein n=1 Tax=Adineta steineri TaxID=433720 RepID=A0A819TSP0_9BILA|nr:unnamed protein product [Adineta steineri]CAF4084300.1 unnamed protein product [Adineta steineri]
MKRNIQNEKDVQASQTKRIRGDTSIRQKENTFDNGIASQKRWSKKDTQHMKDNQFGSESDHENGNNITTSTPTTSGTSFSSSSKRLPLSQRPSSQANQKITTEHNASQSITLSDSTNGSIGSRTSSSKTTLSKGSTKANSTSIKPIDNTDRNASHSNSQVRSSSASINKNPIINTQNFTTSSTFNDRATSQRSSSSSSFLDLNNSRSNDFPTHSLIEGSIEYRELKRMYAREQNLVEEWRKDYQVLKTQLNYLKSNTIPRPTAAVTEWLEELFHLMKDNKAFPGDGRNLKSIGEDLGLEPENLVTVAARTPQKSALKLFRLLYPTIGNRAACVSISKLPKEQLQNIYSEIFSHHIIIFSLSNLVYVRTLHPNLTFHMTDMKNAIGTSIRSARSELRRSERYQQQHINVIEYDERIDAASDDDNENEDGDNDDEEKENDDDDDNQEDDSDVDNMIVDDEIDEAEDDN